MPAVHFCHKPAPLGRESRSPRQQCLEQITLLLWTCDFLTACRLHVASGLFSSRLVLRDALPEAQFAQAGFIDLSAEPRRLQARMYHRCSAFCFLCAGVLSKGRVRCPWHGACFNIGTGDIEDFPGLDSLPRFQVRSLFLSAWPVWKCGPNTWWPVGPPHSSSLSCKLLLFVTLR